jgi:hypothetical protein
MFGCLARLGCLALVIILAAAAWFGRDWWMPRVMGDREARAASVAEAQWEPVTPAAAAGGRAGVQRIQQAGGPGVVRLRPAEVAGYVLDEVVRELPPSAQGVEATSIGDRLYVRALVSLRELGGDALGPFASMLGDRDTLTLGGQLEVLAPGSGQFRVREVRVAQFGIPQAVIPRLLRQLRGGRQLPPGVDDDAIPLQIPRGIGEVRVSGGQVTLYKDAQP